MATIEVTYDRLLDRFRAMSICSRLRVSYLALAGLTALTDVRTFGRLAGKIIVSMVLAATPPRTAADDATPQARVCLAR